VRLDYAAQGIDEFDWQVFTPEEIESLAAKFGLTLIITCTSFDENCPASPDSPRMQLVFEKR
jgi:hypothetical protein